MTVGEAFLSELEKMHLRYGLFKYQQYQMLKKIDSIDELRQLLRSWRYRKIEPDDDLPTLAKRLIPPKMNPQDMFLMQLMNLALNPVGIVLLPLLLPVFCIYLAKSGRNHLQYTIYDMLGFMTLFAVILSYELSVASHVTKSLFLVHWFTSMLFAAALGGSLYWFTRNRIWLALSLTITAECEAVIFLVHWFNK